MLRPARWLPVLRLCASFLLVAQGVPADAAEIFPAGARLSFPDQSLVTFKINAAGPSVLWVTASCPSLQSLQITSGEATAIVEDAAGAAECVIPVHAAGLIEVTVRTRGTGRGTPVILTSYYGIGDIRDTMIEWSPPVASAAAPAPASAVARPTSSAPSGTASSPPAVVPPPAASSPVSSPMPAAPRETVSPPPPTDLIVHGATAIPLSVGEWKTGSFTSPGAVVTYRLYVPNRLGFSLQTAGNCAVRVQSVQGTFDRMEKEGPENRTIHVAAPTDGFYLVSLSGSGSYGVKAEIKR